MKAATLAMETPMSETLSLPPAHAPFDQLSAVSFEEPLRARAVLPDGWHQGRGLFGGLVVATMARALQESSPERQIRSITAEICGPVQPGELTLELSPLREGSAVTTTAVKLIQGDGVQAHAVAVLGKVRTNERDGLWIAPPVMRPWREVAVIPVQPPMGPEFGQNFEFRPTGKLPFSANNVTEVEGWTRPRQPGEARDVAFLVNIIDSFWPVLYNFERRPRPMATIAFTFQALGSFEGLDPEAPLYYRSRLLANDGGYSVEQRELWGEDGRLMALNQQTMVIIK